MPLRKMLAVPTWHTCFSESEALTSNMEIRCRHCVVLHLGTALQPACSMQRLAWSQQSQPAGWAQRNNGVSQRRSHARNTHCGKNFIGTLQGCDKSLPWRTARLTSSTKRRKDPSWPMV